MQDGTEKRDIFALDDAEFRRHLDDEITRGHEACDLYVANADGSPKFWVKLRPRVYLVGGNTTYHGLSEFLSESLVGDWDTDAPNGKSKLVEAAGRLCYWSFPNPRPGGHEGYINHILEAGHGSVLEHAVFNFIITGVSRSFTHELVRHRIASYSQLSQRFFSEKECSFIMPPKIAADPLLRQIFLDSCETSYDAYIRLVEILSEKFTDIVCENPREQKTLRIKAARGEARSVLPNATETKIFVTINARSLRHLIEIRFSDQADQEIRRVAGAMFDLVLEDSPSLFSDYIIHESDGIGRHATTPNKKV